MSRNIKYIHFFSLKMIAPPVFCDSDRKGKPQLAPALAAGCLEWGWRGSDLSRGWLLPPRQTLQELTLEAARLFLHGCALQMDSEAFLEGGLGSPRHLCVLQRREASSMRPFADAGGLALLRRHPRRTDNRD